MPRYYFHVRSFGSFQRDVEGVELCSNDLARQKAIEAARAVLAPCIARGQTFDGRSFEIADEEGTVVEIVSFNAAIRRY